MDKGSIASIKPTTGAILSFPYLRLPCVSKLRAARKSKLYVDYWIRAMSIIELGRLSVPWNYLIGSRYELQFWRWGRVLLHLARDLPIGMSFVRKFPYPCSLSCPLWLIPPIKSDMMGILYVFSCRFLFFLVAHRSDECTGDKRTHSFILSRRILSIDQ